MSLLDSKVPGHRIARDRIAYASALDCVVAVIEECKHSAENQTELLVVQDMTLTFAASPFPTIRGKRP